MTLRFVDSFDHYATADLEKKWNNVYGSGSFSNILGGGAGRNGTQALYFTSAYNGSGYVSKTFDSQASWVVGVAYKFTVMETRSILQLYDGSTLHVILQRNVDGTLSVIHGNTITVLLGPSSNSLAINTQYFIEFKATIGDSAAAGTLAVRVNGSVWLSNSGSVDTRNGGNASASVVQLGSATAGNSLMYYDDLYVCDGVDATATQGAPFNDFLGDCRVKALNAAADGNYTGSWTRNGAGVDADYKAVDEALQDGDTTYLSDNTTDHRSSWTFGSMGTVGTVKAVAMNVMARKDDAGTKLLDVFARRSSTDTDRNDDFSLPDTYVNFQDIWGTHPDTTAWTPTIVNALEAGIRMDT